MRLLLAANNQATRRNEIIKNYLQLGSSSNRYAPRLPQQETKSSTKQLPPTGPILGPENILKTGFAQKGLPTEEARTCEAWFHLSFRPQKWNLKAHMWHQLSPFPSSNAAIAIQHHPGNIHQSVATPATPLLRGMS